MFHVMRLEFHILLFSPRPLFFVSQTGSLSHDYVEWTWGKRWENECRYPTEVWGKHHLLCHRSLGWGPAGTCTNFAFSSSWKGENVATTEVADIVGLVDFVQEVNVYGVSVPGMHKISMSMPKPI